MVLLFAQFRSLRAKDGRREQAIEKTQWTRKKIMIMEKILCRSSCIPRSMQYFVRLKWTELKWNKKPENNRNHLVDCCVLPSLFKLMNKWRDEKATAAGAAAAAQNIDILFSTWKSHHDFAHIQNGFECAAIQIKFANTWFVFCDVCGIWYARTSLE